MESKWRLLLRNLSNNIANFLASMDDAFLIRLVSQLPPKAILLIEDIDCAFPSRDEDEIDEDDLPYELRRNQKGSEVTLSGLLNILDGISSGGYIHPLRCLINVDSAFHAITRGRKIILRDGMSLNLFSFCCCQNSNW